MGPSDRVEVVVRLDPDLDWRSFQFTEFGFGDLLFAVPQESQSFNSSVDVHHNDHLFQVEVELTSHPQTGSLRAIFQSLGSPNEMPATLLNDFLRSEGGVGEGVGHVSFTVQPKADLPTGREIHSSAEVTFDQSRSTAKNEIGSLDLSPDSYRELQSLVIIDSAAPTSEVLPVAWTTSGSELAFSWAGDDGPLGSGIRDYTIYVSENGGEPRVWSDQTSETQATMSVVSGSTYSLFSVAADSVGNLEDRPAEYDLTISSFAGAPTVEEIVINDGSEQRSSVSTVTLKFDSMVDIDSSSADPFQFTNTVLDVAVEEVVNASVVDGKTVIQFEFLPGVSVAENGTLLDGQYRLIVDANLVTSGGASLDGDGDGNGGDNYVFGQSAADAFFRIYGDSNGNGVVDLLDFADFRRTYGMEQGDAQFAGHLDADADNLIGLLDFAAFRRGFGGAGVIAEPVIRLQPQSTAASIGSTGSFAVEAANVASYQWQNDKGLGFIDIEGANEATYETPPLDHTDDNTKYRCIVTGPGGSIISEVASVTIFDHYIKSQADFDALSMPLGVGESVGIATGTDLVGWLRARGNVTAYGDGMPPTISALRRVEDTWTQNDTYDQVYEIEWDISNITVNISRLVLLVDGEYIERVSDLEAVASTPGSYYNDNVGLGRDEDDLRTVYYHPAGSSNPNLDGRVLTLPGYDNSITNRGEWTTSGIELIGNAHDNGALHTYQGKTQDAEPMEGQTIERMLLRHGTKHNALVGSGSVSDTIFHLHDGRTQEEPANGIFGVYEPNTDGLTLEVNNVHIIASEADDRRDTPSDPVTMHSSDGSTYDAFTWRGGSIRSTAYPTIGSAKSVEVDGMFVDRLGSIILPATMTEGNSANNPIEMNRILGRLTIDESRVASGVVFGRSYVEWNDLALATGSRSGIYPQWYFFSDSWWKFNNTAYVSVDDGGYGGVAFNGLADSNNVEFNNSIWYTKDYRIAYGLDNITANRSVFITRTTLAPSTGDNIDYNTNLWINPSNVSNYLAPLGLVTTGDPAGDIEALVEAFFLNGLAGVENGDFRLAPAVDGLQFPDGAYLGDHNIGPQSHWDHNLRQAVDGPPTQWPSTPVTLEDSRAFIADPEGWDFYPETQ